VLVAADDRFEPRVILVALERRRVNYVVIGALARVLHGTDEVTGGVDVCPQRREENLERLDAALRDLDAAPVADEVRAGEVAIRRETHAGLVQVVSVPEGTRGGWDDLRRHANREALGDGLRAAVASLDDLLRMNAALDREPDDAVRPQLRRLAVLERSLGIEL
jgi:hypothetical protein